MHDIETVDDHVRLLARWDEFDRMIFIRYDVLEELAGKRMNRAACERYVDRNRETIIAMGRRQAEEHPIDHSKIVVIDELDYAAREQMEGGH